MQKTGFWLTFYRRGLICFLLCIFLFFGSVMRVTTIATTDYSAVKSTKNGIRLTIGRSRGTIYDCNGKKLTQDAEKIIAAISPTPIAITALGQVLEGEELKSVLERLKTGKPVLCELPREIDSKGIICFKTYGNSKTATPHILGYTDNSGVGVTGIEKAYNDILYCDSQISLYYETDAKGRPLEGVQPEITNPNHNLTNGIYTTIDKEIQEIAEIEATALERGAIIIAEAKSGKLRAVVSRPFFDGNNVEIYLNSPSSPLLNRAINAYNVGSVFKPLVAAAGIENKISNFEYTCTGSCEIIDRHFRCHKLDGHGKMNLKKALAFSCNTFFYNFAFKIGKNSVLNLAKRLSFGQELTLCKEIKTAKGNLPDAKTLENIAHLANFSIGQGELLLSPISILTLYCSIAAEGYYRIPTLVEATMTNGKKTESEIVYPTKAFEKSTAEMLKKYLKSVITDGTGEKAKPKTVSAAGKTATAQTGKYEKGKEICQGWFCGFFPAENPEYVVTVFSEDDTKQNRSCGEIFARIADQITALQKNNG